MLLSHLGRVWEQDSVWVLGETEISLVLDGERWVECRGGFSAWEGRA